MTAVAFPPGADLASKLDAIAQAAIEGSVSSAVRDRAVSASRQASGDPWDAFALAYEELRERFVQLRDPGHDAGHDLIEPAAVTLGRMAGDCDDATTLVLALARALGFRGAIATLSIKTPDGLVPLHVYAVIERAEGAWSAADLFEELPLGEDPGEMYSTAVMERWPIEDRAPALGFIDGIFNVVASIIGGNANKSVARENRAGAEAQANAVIEQSDAQERIAAEGADVQRDAIEASREQANLQAALAARAQDQAADTSRNVLAFARDMFPVLAVVMALKALAPVADSLVRGA